jgi:hypothetical protein
MFSCRLQSINRFGLRYLLESLQTALVKGSPDVTTSYLQVLQKRAKRRIYSNGFCISVLYCVSGRKRVTKARYCGVNA